MEIQEQERTSTSWSGKKTLLVDDYPAVRKNLKGLLEDLGLVCIEAEDGLKAQEKLKTEAVDLIVTDLVMPEMDGFELTEAVKNSASWRSIPVVIVSTHTDSRYIIKALKLGADDYLTKPAKPDLVRIVLNRIFNHDW